LCEPPLLLQATNPQSMQAPTMLLMNLKGRIVPDSGGRETQLDCNLLYNVSTQQQLKQRQQPTQLPSAGRPCWCLLLGLSLDTCMLSPRLLQSSFAL
jgi:hypothetical protein